MITATGPARTVRLPPPRIFFGCRGVARLRLGFNLCTIYIYIVNEVRTSLNKYWICHHAT